MKKLTDKQQAFVTNKAAGVGNRDAAIAAGYAESSADVAAAKLVARADIKDAIKAASRTTDAAPDKLTMPRAEYTDPLEFLMDVMNHHHLPIAMRADAAKQLLPYHHARMGEIGKKELAQQRAQQVVGSARSLFAPKAPPKLRSIPGGKDD